MTGYPRDRGAYRIAVGAIGCALIVVLAGLCVIVALGEEDIPKDLWIIASALGGGLLGLLAPAPAPSAAGKEEVKQIEGPIKRSRAILAKDIWANRSVVILLIVFGVSAVLGASNDSSQLQALAAASGAALIGLLAPTPAKDTPAA